MRKKLTILFALLCASMMGWADTELFNAASAEIKRTFFKTYGWGEETTPSSATWSDAELVISMTEGKNAQWQAQVFFDTKITFEASKKYTVSFDITTSNGVGGVMVKLCDAGTMYSETITTGAGVPQHYAKENIQGVAGNDGMLIFDFGYAPANTVVTITNISILEQDAPSTPDTYCQKATGHNGNPDFGDPNGRILLTITKLSNSSVGVKVEPNNGGADVFDFVEVILAGVSKTLGTIGGSTPTTAEIVYDGLASLNFNVNVLWHHKTWGDAAGRWTTQSFAVTEAELCPAPPVSEYCLYQDPQTIKGGKNIALTWETVANGNVVITMSNGTGTTSCSFRNGGFEGGIGAFIVSTDDFVTSEPASNYFTATQVYSGNTYTLTKIADLPDNAKIKHVGSGHALAWVLDGNDEYCSPDFIYTYGGICNEEPELTSIEMSSSTAIAQVGAGITITASPLDQFGAPIEATINYEISPSDAGEIVGNVFTFAKLGAATITARSGDVQNSIALYCVSSDNLALNKDCEGGSYDGNPSETAAKANDGADNTAWVTYANQPASVEWWYVDLGNLYNITAISALWGNDYSTNYILQVRTVAPEEADKANDEAWTTIAPVTNASAGNIALNYVTAQGRYVRIHSLNRSGNCIRLRELRVFGSEAVTPTKSVSADVNDPAMGTATVKQKDAVVTEVTTGSTVTFSAVANDGYVFVNWSNRETRATFDAVVNSTMKLTANFRALNHISCNEEMTNGDYTAYVTYRKTANENEYEFIVRSAQTMTGFSNTNIGHLNGSNHFNLNGQGSLTGNGHKLSYTFTSTTEPKLNTPLYVNFANHGEVTFNQINNSTVFEFSQPCTDPEITAIELNKTEATLDMGNTLTLVPTFTPAYMSADITWQTSDANIATVSNGVVTPVTTGNVTITAKVTEDIKATCSVTVQDAASHNWYGYGTDKDLDYTYRIEYTTDQRIVAHVKRQGNKTGLVDVGMNINNNWTAINVTEGEEEGWKKGTTEATFTTGDNIHIIFQSNWAGPSSIIEFNYEVGSDNDMPTILPSTLALSNTSITMGLSDADIQLTAEIHHRDAANKTITWTSDNESIVTVVDGLVHPVGVGRTTVHAATFNGISATCEVTVEEALEPTIFWGSGEDAGISILYSITRNADHTLTYAVEALHNKGGFELQVNDGNWHNATLDEGVYTWSSTATYTDGDAFNGFFYMPFSVGAGRVDFHYVVGSKFEKGNMPIRLYEDQDNSFMITASDGLIRDVKVTRSFTSGSLYTLVLPFDVDAAQTASQLPGQLTKLNNSYLKDNGDLRLNFVDASAIEAGVPYLYQPSADVTNPTFEGVTVSAARNQSEADPMAKYYGIYAPMDGNALHTITNAYVLGPDQYLYAVSDLPNNQTMKALRAYFVLNFPSAEPGAPKRLAKVVFNSSETEGTTDYENLQTDNTCIKVIVNGQLQIIRDGKTYNAFGQLVK